MTRVFEVLVRGRMSPQLAQALDGFTVQDRPGGLTSILGPVSYTHLTLPTILLV